MDCDHGKGMSCKSVDRPYRTRWIHPVDMFVPGENITSRCQDGSDLVENGNFTTTCKSSHGTRSLAQSQMCRYEPYITLYVVERYIEFLQNSSAFSHPIAKFFGDAVASTHVA